ncbi:MAG TPA: spore maturation protein [Firmicutes bacterium]|nr:spore maturation protein [Bacillota bacterium]
MVNLIWFLLIATGVVTGALSGRNEAVTRAALSGAQDAVALVFGLIGVITMWSGVMRIAEEAGLTEMIGRFVKPVAARIFPGVPQDHPAMTAIVMNIIANILGMGNAATPLGLKAMEEMQKLNKKKDEASDAMCTFLALNLSVVVLVPTTVIALRAQHGSTNPSETVGPTIFLTMCCMVLTLVADRVMRGLSSSGRRRRR